MPELATQNNTGGGRCVFEQFGQFELKLLNYFVGEVSLEITVIVERLCVAGI